MPRLLPAGLVKKQRQNIKWYCVKAVGLNLSCCKLKHCHLIPRNYTSLLQQRVGIENFKRDSSHIIIREMLNFLLERKGWVHLNHEPREMRAGGMRQPCSCCLARWPEPACESDSSLRSSFEITASQTRLLRVTCTLHKDNRWKSWFRATAKNKNVFQREKELVFLCLNLWSSFTSEGKRGPFAEDTWFCICENTAV